MDEQDGVSATMAGRIASFYYLQHETMDLFMHHMHADADVAAVLKILASAPEYDELPVRLRHVALAAPAARSTPRTETIWTILKTHAATSVCHSRA